MTDAERDEHARLNGETWHEGETWIDEGEQAARYLERTARSIRRQRRSWRDGHMTTAEAVALLDAARALYDRVRDAEMAVAQPTPEEREAALLEAQRLGFIVDVQR